MVEQAVQTMPMANAGQKRGKAPTQQQGKPAVRPAQRSVRGGAQAQTQSVPVGKRRRR